MRIGGYQMEDLGYCIVVKEYEAGWSFSLQGDDANQFREEWEKWEDLVSSDFRHFLSTHDYDTLFK